MVTAPGAQESIRDYKDEFVNDLESYLYTGDGRAHRFLSRWLAFGCFVSHLIVCYGQMGLVAAAHRRLLKQISFATSTWISLIQQLSRATMRSGHWRRVLW